MITPCAGGQASASTGSMIQERAEEVADKTESGLLSLPLPAWRKVAEHLVSDNITNLLQLKLTCKNVASLVNQDILPSLLFERLSIRGRRVVVHTYDQSQYQNYFRSWMQKFDEQSVHYMDELAASYKENEFPDWIEFPKQLCFHHLNSLAKLEAVGVKSKKMPIAFMAREVGFSPNGQHIAAISTDGKKISVMSINANGDYEVKNAFAEDVCISKLTYSEDSNYLAVVGEKTNVIIFYFLDRSRCWERHSKLNLGVELNYCINSVRFIPDQLPLSIKITYLKSNNASVFSCQATVPDKPGSTSHDQWSWKNIIDTKELPESAKVVITSSDLRFLVAQDMSATGKFIIYQSQSDPKERWGVMHSIENTNAEGIACDLGISLDSVLITELLKFSYNSRHLCLCMSSINRSIRSGNKIYTLNRDNTEWLKTSDMDSGVQFFQFSDGGQYLFALSFGTVEFDSIKMIVEIYEFDEQQWCWTSKQEFDFGKARVGRQFMHCSIFQEINTCLALRTLNRFFIAKKNGKDGLFHSVANENVVCEHIIDDMSEHELLNLTNDNQLFVMKRSKGIGHGYDDFIVYDIKGCEKIDKKVTIRRKITGKTTLWWSKDCRHIICSKHSSGQSRAEMRMYELYPKAKAKDQQGGSGEDDSIIYLDQVLLRNKPNVLCRQPGILNVENSSVLEYSHRVQNQVFSNDGHHMVTMLAEGKARLQTLNQITTRWDDKGFIPDQGQGIRRVDFHEDNNWLLTNSQQNVAFGQGVAILYEINQTGELTEVATIDSVTLASFMPGGEFISLRNEGLITIIPLKRRRTALK